jgi:hypothetical protein
MDGPAEMIVVTNLKRGNGNATTSFTIAAEPNSNQTSKIGNITQETNF